MASSRATLGTPLRRRWLTRLLRVALATALVSLPTRKSRRLGTQVEHCGLSFPPPSGFCDEFAKGLARSRHISKLFLAIGKEEEDRKLLLALFEELHRSSEMGPGIGESPFAHP